MNPASTSGEATMDFPKPLTTHGPAWRPLLRTTGEATRFIDEDIAVELSSLPRWTLARELLIAAEQSGKKGDLKPAVRQLQSALNQDGSSEAAMKTMNTSLTETNS
jgi:hypothetical protein